MTDDQAGGGGTILAMDHGARRIGLAIRPAGSTLVLPLDILEVRGEPQAMGALRKLIRERGITTVVTGLPRNADPTQEQAVKKFTRKLRQGVEGVRWRFVDETLSSAEAQDRRNATGLTFAPKTLDSIAASVILENYLAAEAGAAKNKEAGE